MEPLLPYQFTSPDSRLEFGVDYSVILKCGESDEHILCQVSTITI